MFKALRLTTWLFVLTLTIPVLAETSLEDFHQFIRSGNVEDVARLLDQHPGWLNAKDSNNLPPLSQAVIAGQIEVVSLLIEKGADMEAGDNEGSTPLHNACASGRFEIVRYLLAKGAQINSRDNFGMTALLFASSRGRTDIVDYLLQKGADISAKTDNNRGVMLLSGQLEMLKYFMDKGFSINEKDQDGNSLLHMALFRRNPVMIRGLIDAGIDVNSANNFGATPLMNSVFRGDPALTEILLKAGANPDACDTRGLSPLMESVRSGKPALLQLMLQYNGSVQGLDSLTGLNLLNMAAIRGQSDAVGMIIEKNQLNVNAVNRNGMAALDYANKYGHKKVSELLMKNGAAKPKIKSEFGFSMELNKKLKSGTAWIWYLGHSGWAVKTQNHLLIFDYWETASKPDEIFLRSGYIIPEEIKDLNVLVFSSHEHQDHFIPDIFQWRDQVRNINYILGHRPEQFSGYEFMSPREQKNINEVDIKTIYSNDTGVGFLVTVDGLTLFHAGDHANRNRDLSGDYTPEIDYISQQASKIDIAFLPNSGCNFGDNVAVRTGSLYAIKKLHPKAVFPMHNGEYFSSTYQEFKDEALQKGVSTPIICAMNRGDKFYYKKGKIQIK
ncbi:MAG: ankyrin repeat domain-containing protein [Candidatus Marinimicrobia bacterium]|nr:ankyrin repeat domain-containing protein [Candidatus Neomarinimicrobiota bacterium]